MTNRFRRVDRLAGTKDFRGQRRRDRDEGGQQPLQRHRIGSDQCNGSNAEPAADHEGTL